MSRTYIICSWEIRVGVHRIFLECLKQLASHLKAELLLAPVWPDDLDFLPPMLKGMFTPLTEDHLFNDNLLYKAVPTSALAKNPVAQWKGVHPSRSVIIPGLVKHLQTENSPKLAKQNMTTGSVGYLDAPLSNYKHVSPVESDDESAFERWKLFEKRWKWAQARNRGHVYAVARERVKPSALIVEIANKKTFFTRYVTYEGKGCLYDLNYKYTPKGRAKSRPEGLVLGDSHCFHRDEQTWRAGLRMIEEFKPKRVFLNDFFDGASVNHHEAEQAAEFHGAPTIDEEAKVTRKCLDEITKRAEHVIYLCSNHDNFLLKYLDKGTKWWKLNRNYGVCASLEGFRVETGRHPIEKLLDLDGFKNLTFQSERNSFRCAGVSVLHGHQGVSGRRAGFEAMARIYHRLNMGHVHSPGVYNDSVANGTGSVLDPRYKMGDAGARLGANTLIHPDSSQQLLMVIYGNYKAG